MNVKSRLGGLAVVAVAVFAPGAFERGWAQDTDYLAMLEFFSNCQAPQPFPLGSSKGVEIGDRCYLGYPGRSAIPSIAFVRNNIFADVSSESGDYSVLRLAEKLDNELKAWSFIQPLLLEPSLGNGTFQVSVLTTPAKMYVLSGFGVSP